MERHFEIAKEFRKIEFGSKIDKAINARMKGFENMSIQKDDKVFIKPIMRRLGLDLLRCWMWIRIGYLLLETETLRRCQNVMLN